MDCEMYPANRLSIIFAMGRNPLRELPSVDRLLVDNRIAPLVEAHGRPLVVAAVRAALARAREELQAGYEAGDLAARVAAELAALERPRLRRTLNATGVVIHTNLGRAPLAEEALARALKAARGYSNLEYDLAEGSRGSRQDHAAPLLRELTGAEAALVVNNNAGAVLLALAALAERRQVVVSRGELIEIGDGFRIPDVLARSGAELVEVGTTNRTRVADYERAIGERTALLLRVHQSNFRMVGFTEQPSVRELAALATRHSLPLVDDLGSGALEPSNSLLQGRTWPDEPTARESLEAGADLVCFSGDKLLGGPQAGIVVGRAELVERLRRHPLQRALRPDKLTLAALEGTLALYRAGRAGEIPVLRMLAEPAEAVRARAERLAELTGGEVEPAAARIGGGALPLAEVESYACALELELAEPLRGGDPPVIGIVREGRLLLDCRTLAEGEIDTVAAVVVAARP
jgi:L-seryl-tRNA(Ser) seleniumtransferase